MEYEARGDREQPAEEEREREERQRDARRVRPARRVKGRERAGDEREQSEGEPDPAEEGQGLVVAEERERRVEYEEAVAHEANLRVAAVGARHEVYGNLYEAEAAADGLNRQLGLYLEAAAEERQTFDEIPVEHPVARQYVAQAHAEDEVERGAHEPVARAIQLFELAARLGVQARADGHVGIAR